MKKFRAAIGDWFRSVFETWDRFWFTAIDPTTIGLIRALAGSMLFYTHLVWSLRLTQFFGADGWLPAEQSQLAANNSSFAWSHLYLIGDTTTLWIVHIAALIVLLMFALGLFSRTTSVLAALIAISYANRASGVLFGLDQINILLAIYLAIAPCGAAFSLDNLIAKRFRKNRGRAGGPKNSGPAKSVTANIAARLIQIHMCIIYLFAGTGKLLGDSWWNGEAIWMSVANYEYQSMDLTWMANFPILVNLLTHLTVAFEISYIALVWPKLTRPVVLLTAVFLHLGIAFGMGMMTFGMIMIIANIAFIPPQVIRGIFRRDEIQFKSATAH